MLNSWGNLNPRLLFRPSVQHSSKMRHSLLKKLCLRIKSHDREIVPLVSTIEHSQKLEIPAQLKTFPACQFFILKKAGFSR